jgi:hypothetical protein
LDPPRWCVALPLVPLVARCVTELTDSPLSHPHGINIITINIIIQIAVFFPKACASLGVSLDDADSERRLQLAGVMSFWVGVSTCVPSLPSHPFVSDAIHPFHPHAIQIVFLLCGLLRVSKLIRFLSHSVMTGFTSGAAFYLGFAQLKSCFGITVRASLHPLAFPERGGQRYR